MSQPAGGLSFPAHHPIKAVGHNLPEFKPRMLQCLQEELGQDSAIEVSEKLSRDAGFISLTLTVWVDSREQLERIYQRLHASGLLLFAL